MKKSLRSLITLAVFVAGTLSMAAAQNPALDLLNAGRFDAAVRLLDEQVKANPNNAEAYNLLCRAYNSVEDWDAAIRNGERAVQLQPSRGAYHLWLGRAYGGKADNAGGLSAFALARKTVASFQRAVQLDPTDIHAKEDLAEFYVEAPGMVGGGKDKARALADQVAASAPSLAHWIRARILMKDKNLPESEREYKESIAASGNLPSAILELARFYKWTGRNDEVQSTVARALSSEKRTPMDLFTGAELLDGAGRNYSGAIQLLKIYLAGKTVEGAPAFRAHFLVGEMLEKTGDRVAAAAEYKAALALASNYRLARNGLSRLAR